VTDLAPPAEAARWPGPGLQWQVLRNAPYAEVFDAMRDYTATRTDDTPDALWLCEHPPVFTQGLAGLADHVLAPGDIPVVASNRGGQVTYHGPGQVVAYPLLDLRRRGYFVKELVFRLEEAVIRTLADHGLTGHRVRGAPGIYVRPEDPGSHQRLPEPAPGQDPFQGLAKIAALGIKVTRSCSWHGLALNVDMDLTPFNGINPCGYEGMLTIDLRTAGVKMKTKAVAHLLIGQLLDALQKAQSATQIP